ncbi:sigma-70 family RNA polymerase sigma factor [Lyngbya aestuarii]|uniref:sigma-70 family RNA polymerase sigma factor n=1 Tax=Lyngbya aestuarii TaxID=118322 RepID=UPI00403DAA32
MRILFFYFAIEVPLQDKQSFLINLLCQLENLRIFAETQKAAVKIFRKTTLAAEFLFPDNKETDLFAYSNFLQETDFCRWDFFMMVNQSLDFQNMELLIAYYKNPSIEVRNRLVQFNAGLVKKIAHRLSLQCTEPYEDLEQMGYVGLIRAIERFNPYQGGIFSSFAVHFIRGEMLHFLRDNGFLVKIPRRWQELHQQGKQVSKKLTVTLGRFPKDAEIAKALKVSLSKWQETKLAAQNRWPLSLDATLNQMIDSSVTLGETLPDTTEQSWKNCQEERQQLQRAISQLEGKTQAAIEFVFLRELSRKEVAKQIGVSPMTVSRHVQRGVNQLVSILEKQTPGRLAS